MRIYLVLAVVFALTTLISASDADQCPTWCFFPSTCHPCPHKLCVSMSSLRPEFNYITHCLAVALRMLLVWW
ncbi:hypothetical protein C8R48DRAFT_712734 [Suillus tomentosus]|nr:hypothetical protein C8R48DRAFT_712734 [Suillus tomentosus]